MRYLLLVLTFFSVAPAKAEWFSAAGRVEKVSGGGCSASLVGADVIVTAAHCVTEADTQDYVFRLGGEYNTKTVSVETIVIHPHYIGFKNQKLRRLRFDIAVGKLARPVDASAAEPLVLGSEAKPGEGLFLASWRGRGPRPRTRRCLVIDGKVPGVVALGCRVRGGESGAPVLRLTDQGVELVAVINSRSELNGRDIAYASNVRLRIAPLIDRLPGDP